MNNNFVIKLKRRNARKRRCRVRIKNQRMCRLTVYRSAKNIYAQIFSSDNFFVLVSASSIDKDVKSSLEKKAKKKPLRIKDLEKKLKKSYFFY